LTPLRDRSIIIYTRTNKEGTTEMTENTVDTINRIAAEIEAEELAASLLEGAAPISPEALELLQQYRQINLDIKKLKADLDPIKELVTAEMRKKGVSKLTHEGVVVVENVVTHTKKVDIPALVRKFPMAVRFITESVGTRFDVKKF
jgi:energy-converting hydrogenase Eha subunit F